MLYIFTPEAKICSATRSTVPLNPFKPSLNLAPMPIKFPFVLKLSTALERHVSWNYLDFCGYFFSDWVLRPDSSRHQYSQDQAVCAFTIWGCGLSQDFQSLLAAGEWLRLFSGNCCGHIRAQNKSEGALAPRLFLPEPLGCVTLLMALTQWLFLPQKPGRAGLTFPLTSEDDKKIPGKNISLFQQFQQPA